MFGTVGDFDEKGFSPILIVLKPLLILCKCFGILSLPVINCTNLTQVKYKFPSVSIVYQVGFIVICEPNVHGLYSYFMFQEHLTMGTFVHILILMLYIVCMITDKKLLEVLNTIDAADKQLEHLVLSKYNRAGETAYKWILYVVCLELWLYFFVYCTEKCDQSYIMTVVYRQTPFLLNTSLFCSISTELKKRFQLLKMTLQDNSTRCDDAMYLEECRGVHCKLALSTELFCQSFGARITLLLFMITIHTISFFCFPCIHGSGCKATFIIKGIVHETILVSVICYHASQVDKESQELLDNLNQIPLNRSPYRCQDQIQLFSCQVVLSPLKVSALGLFDVDMSMILAVLSVTLMYSVIVAQLGDRLELYMVS